MSIGALTIILSVLENKKYEREQTEELVIQTSKKTGERPNDMLVKLINDRVNDTKFSVTLEDYGSFRSVENAVNKMKNVIIKEGVKEKLKFRFSFKSFYPKGRLSNYKHLQYSFNKNKRFIITVVVRPPKYDKKYEINYSCMRYRAKTVEELVEDTRGLIYTIKQRHYTAVDQNYEMCEEGYCSWLDEAAGFSSCPACESEEFINIANTEKLRIVPNSFWIVSWLHF